MIFGFIPFFKFVHLLLFLVIDPEGVVLVELYYKYLLDCILNILSMLSIPHFNGPI